MTKETRLILWQIFNYVGFGGGCVLIELGHIVLGSITAAVLLTLAYYVAPEE